MSVCGFGRENSFYNQIIIPFNVKFKNNQTILPKCGIDAPAVLGYIYYSLSRGLAFVEAGGERKTGRGIFI